MAAASQLSQVNDRLARIEEMIAAMAVRTESEDLLDTKAAAAVLGVTPGWLRQMCHARLVPHYKVASRLMFSRAELLAHRKTHRVASATEIERIATRQISRRDT